VPAGLQQARLGPWVCGMPLFKQVARKHKLVLLIDAVGSLLFLPNLIRRRTIRAEGLDHIRRILWINLWGLGDLTLATPALASLRQRFPGARISVLVSPEIAALVEHCPWIDEILPATVPWSAGRRGRYNPRRYVEKEFVDLLRFLRQRSFDLAIDGHADIRNNMLSFLIGAHRRLGLDYGGGRFFLTDLVPPDFSRPHHAQVMMQLVAYLGGKPVLEHPKLHVAPEDREAANEFWIKHGLHQARLVVGIHPGAGHPVRQWGLDRFAAVADALAQKFPARIVAFAQPDGYGSKLPMRNEHVRAQPELGLLMALLEKCGLLICNDGGPMHIAAALDTPVVAVFGPTEPRWWSPCGANHSLVILDRFACRPCTNLCKFSQPYCLTELPVDLVTSVAEDQIRRLLTESRISE